MRKRVEQKSGNNTCTVKMLQSRCNTVQDSAGLSLVKHFPLLDVIDQGSTPHHLKH